MPLFLFFMKVSSYSLLAKTNPSFRAEDFFLKLLHHRNGKTPMQHHWMSRQTLLQPFTLGEILRRLTFPAAERSRAPVLELVTEKNGKTRNRKSIKKRPSLLRSLSDSTNKVAFFGLFFGSVGWIRKKFSKNWNFERSSFLLKTAFGEYPCLFSLPARLHDANLCIIL